MRLLWAVEGYCNHQGCWKEEDGEYRATEMGTLHTSRFLVVPTALNGPAQRLPFRSVLGTQHTDAPWREHLPDLVRVGSTLTVKYGLDKSWFLTFYIQVMFSKCHLEKQGQTITGSCFCWLRRSAPQFK